MRDFEHMLFYVGPTSATLAQHKTSTCSAYHFCVPAKIHRRPNQRRVPVSSSAETVSRELISYRTHRRFISWLQSFPDKSYAILFIVLVTLYIEKSLSHAMKTTEISVEFY